MDDKYVLWLEQVRMTDVARVGGKNASLGEMISQLSSAGLRVPGGFATTATAYRDFLKQNDLAVRIERRLEKLDVSDVRDLTESAAEIREWILAQHLQPKLEKEVSKAHERVLSEYGKHISFAVRSSATAEDLPSASFAGQQETLLNISGLENLLSAIHRVFASLYNDRAISYRVHQGFKHSDVALSVGIQKMVRSDLAASGVMFTLDTESGFDQVVLITGSYGLGETVVQGAVNPDEFYVYKPNLQQHRPAIIRRKCGSKDVKLIFAAGDNAGELVKTLPVAEEERRRFCLSDNDIENLARDALRIEEHYGVAMDIEWGKDGVDGQLYILQARPETVKSARKGITQHYRLKQHSEILISGRAIGQRIGSGRVRILKNISEMVRVQQGDVLVADMTDPDWEPIMKRSSAIVTNRGGRTCHAAIVARELGVPAIVGCGKATSVLNENEEITVSCAEGDTGNVYRGILEIETIDVLAENMPELPVKISLIVGNPDLAFDLRTLPNAGVGLARLEFIIARMIGIHPRAVLDFRSLPKKLSDEIQLRTFAYVDPVSFYVEKLVEGVSTLAAAFWPKPVIVRLSDFKSNEYAGLLGGDSYEPKEENPMLGFRGASRYVSPSFSNAFALECRALKKVRDDLGFINVEIMIPFTRTIEEARAAVAELEKNGLRRGDNDLRLIMMCEIPSNVILAEKFLEYFDGFSIGSNDLTQLTLGIDRDSSLVAQGFDERNPAVKALLRQAIQACRRANKYVGICGQGPSDHLDLARWLVEEGIDVLSLNPDSVIDTWLSLADGTTPPS